MVRKRENEEIHTKLSRTQTKKFPLSRALRALVRCPTSFLNLKDTNIVQCNPWKFCLNLLVQSSMSSMRCVMIVSAFHLALEMNRKQMH
eukprot:scaffold1800_cov332-Pavlova_lutheri.AAC.4